MGVIVLCEGLTCLLHYIRERSASVRRKTVTENDCVFLSLCSEQDRLRSVTELLAADYILEL